MCFDYQEMDLFLFKTKTKGKKKQPQLEELLERGGTALVSPLLVDQAPCRGTSVWVLAFSPGLTLGPTGGVFLEFHYLGLPPAILT